MPSTMQPTVPRGSPAEPLALVVLFLALIVLPAAANLAGRDGGDGYAENRELATMPALEPTVDSIVRFGTGFSSWFDDHFGFRSTLVRWYGQSQLALFEASPTTSVVNGREGWFFYADDHGMEDYVNRAPLSESELAAWRETLVATADWLRARSVAYVFTIAPDKHVIYPEFLPHTIRPVRPTSRMDQMFQMLAATDVAAVDVRAALGAGKRVERLYEKTGTHWDARGAFLAYREVIEAVRHQQPAVPPAWPREEFEPVARVIDGKDLAGMMGLKRVMREEDLQLAPIRPRLARVIEPAGRSAGDDVERLVTEIPGSTLPRAVVFRDSFATKMAPFLSEHFSRVVYLWQNEFDPQVILKEHPDVVIQEMVGRHLYGVRPSPESISR